MLPFDDVIITFPDTRAASWASKDPLESLRRKYPETHFHATSDPFDCRCGSFGGTLNAISNAPTESRVLIVHAGGESSRCPTQMILGKAWLTLPCRTGIETPMSIWLRHMEKLLPDLPPGSVVVLASDTLLSLPEELPPVPWDAFPDSVVGVAVPAPLHVARNHGVYILKEDSLARDQSILSHCEGVLQKPTLETLQQAVEGHQDAWIDTGVVIFPSRAARTLRDLANETLRGVSTHDGISERFNQTEGDSDTIEGFAARCVVKMDLYTHALRALQCDSSLTWTLAQYTAVFSELPTNVASILFRSLNQFSLDIFAVPDGHFLHLGTTRELLDFVSGPANTRYELFRQQISLVPRCHSMNNGVLLNQSVMCESTVHGQGHIGTSLVEHCLISESQIDVGDDCLLSGLRGVQPILRIPSRTVVQQVALKDGEGVFVYLVLGLDDDIKGRTSFMGSSLDSLMANIGITKDDIWPTDVDACTLWTAQLHPVTNLPFHMVFGWMSNTDDVVSKLVWKNCRRLSLAHIRSCGDATKEFSFRASMGKEIENVYQRQLSRLSLSLHACDDLHLDLSFLVETVKYTHGPCDWLHRALDIFVTTAISACRQGNLLLASRSCMVLSNVFDRIRQDEHETSSLLCDLTSIEEAENNGLRSERIRIVFDLIHSRINQSTSIGHLAHILHKTLLKLAQILLKLSICGVHHSPSAYLPLERGPMVTGELIVASAPARIDLAGGWSDTPPLCLEHSSGVVGLAVSIDGKRPLSARSRILPGGHGLLLCMEQCDMKTDAIVSRHCCEVLSLDDLTDYSDPSSDGALLKCVLLSLGFLRKHLAMIHKPYVSSHVSLQAAINAFCGSPVDVRLEVTISSTLPHGSGLGTSSILAGCAIASVARCIGYELSVHTNAILHMVLEVEQLLTTGGGYQDQANGLVGGAKFVTCVQEGILSPCIEIRDIYLSPMLLTKLSERLVLVFTGKTRLAKNILVRVLHRWAVRSPEMVHTLMELVKGTKDAESALMEGDLEALGLCLMDYWRQKKRMAGPESGVEPPLVERLMRTMVKANVISGGSLCGAGGGGFLLLVLAEGTSREAAESFVAASFPDIRDLHWHAVNVDLQGLQVSKVRGCGCDLSANHPASFAGSVGVIDSTERSS